MSLLLNAIWPGLAAALLLGGLVGSVSGLPRGRIGLVIAGCLAVTLAALAVVALTSAAPAEVGLWVETAAVMLAAYLAGCALGGVGRLFAVRG